MSRLRAALPHALVALVAIAAHARSLGAGYVYDDRAVVENDERLVDTSRWGELLTSSYWGDFSPDRLYRPVTKLSFAAGAAAFGRSPAAAHAINLALHAAVAAALFATLARVFPAKRGAALAAALLFACHPAFSEAVAGVVGRADLLAALFSIAAVNAAWRGSHPLFAAGAAALAFLSKESAIGLALAVPLAAAARSGAGRFDRRAAGASAVAVGLALGGSLALRAAVLAGEPASPVVPGFAVENPFASAPFTTRTLSALHVLGRYAFVLAFPVRLRSDASYDEIPAVSSPLDAGAIAGAALLLALAAAAVVGLRRRSPVAIAALLALAPLGVVSNLAFPIGTAYGERLLYVPALGLAGLACAGAPFSARAAKPALALALGLFSWRTLRREAIFRDEAAFFAAMVADSPRSAKAWNTLGIHFSEARRYEDADRAFDRALAIYPGYPEALARKGQAALARNDRAAAEALFRAAIAAQPAYGIARLELAQILKDAGPTRFGEAAAEFEEAKRLLPRFPEPAYGLGAVRLLEGREADALAEFDEALRRRPGFGHAHYGRGVIAFSRRDLATAERELRAAIAGAPELWPRTIEPWLGGKATADAGAKALLETLRAAAPR